MISRTLSSGLPKFPPLRILSSAHPRPSTRIAPLTTTTSPRPTKLLTVSRPFRRPEYVLGGGRRWYSQTPDATTAAAKAVEGKVGEKAEKAEEGVDGWKKYTFDEIKHLSLHPRPNTIIIDVREPSELVHGQIPTAINIPLTSSPDALLLSPETFTERFGFEKPDVHKEVVFYCKRGVRSRKAVGVAREGGYEHVSEYPGAWDEWVGKERGGL